MEKNDQNQYSRLILLYILHPKRNTPSTVYPFCGVKYSQAVCLKSGCENILACSFMEDGSLNYNVTIYSLNSLKLQHLDAGDDLESQQKKMTNDRNLLICSVFSIFQTVLTLQIKS